VTAFTFSAWLFGRWRLTHTRQLTLEQAIKVGRHLHWLRWLGFRHIQLEQGAFPTSPIRTLGEPVKREADVLATRLSAEERERARRGDFPIVYSEMFGCDVVGPIWGTEEDPVQSTPPRYTKEGYRLIEGSRTNYALWSEGKP
jgi:hypothetical protein